jgi:hypothetical protein
VIFIANSIFGATVVLNGPSIAESLPPNSRQLIARTRGRNRHAVNAIKGRTVP